jgi:L-alanine-DL-glutamate epimerase-like enolase superfamily enzyme
VPGELQEGLRLIRQHTTTPIAIGEVLPTVWDFRIMIAEQLIDYVRTSVQRAGGISHLPQEPGLGAELDEEAAARVPYERAYLPVNRLFDGTMHSW